MKTTLMVLGFLCATGAAFGQSSNGASALNSEPQIVEFTSHSRRAAQEGMGMEQNLLQRSINVQAHGVRPLWEVATPAYVMPLGDSARMLRKEHEMAKKAEIFWTN